MLAGEIKTLDPSCLITCDSAEPKSITELRQHNIMTVGAQKGKDSVNFGIQWLQQQRIIIDKSCINARNEFQQYQWKRDKDGNALRVPVDKHDHIIDALRYAYEGEAFEAQAVPNPFYD
jgi:phage terminase large subunit